jgi:4-oxalocrotonate tautomerase
MPTLTLKITPPVDATRARALATALTSLSTTLLGKRREVTAVVVEPLPAGQWFVDGRIPSRPTALLAIDITAGTNSADEKARFVAAAFAELQRQLAPHEGLEAASYVQVRELAATDWGYGGLTQAERAAQRRAPADATAVA